MANDKIKIYIILPYLRTTQGIVIGNFQFKAFDDFQKEPKEVKDELSRIISFFRQKETQSIDAFNYLILEREQKKINQLLEELRHTVEIYRYLTVDQEGKGLNAVHTSI